MTSERKKEEMTFVQHLVELRDKLLHSVIAILLIFIGIFPFANEVYGFIAAPIINVLPADTNIIAIGVISPFLTPLKNGADFFSLPSNAILIVSNMVFYCARLIQT